MFPAGYAADLSLSLSDRYGALWGCVSLWNPPLRKEDDCSDLSDVWDGEICDATQYDGMDQISF